MHIVVFGLNHKTAPIEIRERLYIPEEKAKELIEAHKREGAREVVILSTCNRTEVYLFSHEPERDLEISKGIFERYLNVKKDILDGYTYTLQDEDAYRHLLSVSSGLDSMVIGEPQILGQVKDAYRLATFCNSTGSFSNKIFHRAFSCAKRVRTETKIGYNPLSISSMATELAKRIFGELKEKTVLAIGAGEMVEIAVKNLKKEGVKRIIVTNRSLENAKKLAKEIQGEAYSFSELERLIVGADLIITATGSTEYIIRRDLVSKAMKERKSKPLFIVDIAVPRDVEPEVNELENVYLYNIDDLKNLSDAHLKDRLKEAEKAKKIVEEEVKKLPMILRQADVKPLILHILDYFERIREEEVSKVLKKYPSLDEEGRLAVERLSNSISKRIAHPFLSVLKREGNYEVIEALSKIFNFETYDEEDKSWDEGEQTRLKADGDSN